MRDVLLTRGGVNARCARIALPRAVMFRPLRGIFSADPSPDSPQRELDRWRMLSVHRRQLKKLRSARRRSRPPRQTEDSPRSGRATAVNSPDLELRSVGPSAASNGFAAAQAVETTSAATARWPARRGSPLSLSLATSAIVCGEITPPQETARWPSSEGRTLVAVDFLMFLSVGSHSDGIHRWQFADRMPAAQIPRLNVATQATATIGILLQKVAGNRDVALNGLV